jgi:hypothetical protein
MCSYLKQTKLSKTENRRSGQVLSEGLVPVGGERMWGEGVRV